VLICIQEVVHLYDVYVGRAVGSAIKVNEIEQRAAMRVSRSVMMFC